MAHECRNGEEFEPLYCDACGDCVYCYGEDPCAKTEDGRHVTITEHSPDPVAIEDIRNAVTPRQTHTYVLLDIPRAAYLYIKGRLEEAGYQHAINERGELDMQGIALVPQLEGAEHINVELKLSRIEHKDEDGNVIMTETPLEMERVE